MRVSNLYSLRGLAQVPFGPAPDGMPRPPGSPNPYPNGISVSGTGPAGSATTWPVSLRPTGYWGAYTGFGWAPVYTQADFDQWAAAGPGTTAVGLLTRGALQAQPDVTPPGFSGTMTSNDPNGMTSAAGGAFTIGVGKGEQIIAYGYDPQTGYFLPTAAQGESTFQSALVGMSIVAGGIVGATALEVALAPATAADVGADVGATAAADVGSGAAATDVTATATTAEATVAPEVAGFVPTPIVASTPIDAATMAPIDTVAMTDTAAAAATSPISTAFSVVKYVNTLAGAYKSIMSIGSQPVAHPQAGTVTKLPDGSTSTVNVDGGTTVRATDGGVWTILPDGSIVQGAPAQQAPKSQAGTWLLGLAALGVLLQGCATVAYSSATDAQMVRKWDVTIAELADDVCIYNALGYSLVGPLASCAHRGQRLKLIDGEGHALTITQPTPSRYTLKAGQRALYVVDRGQVWVQPADYPLPPEFAQ